MHRLPPVSDTRATSAGRARLIDRGVYGTIVVTSVLVVYDGWAHLRALAAASAASLGIWGGIAARRAGLHGRGIALGVLMGLAAGGVVVLQVFLQPGTAVSNGVAALQFVDVLVT